MQRGTDNYTAVSYLTIFGAKTGELIDDAKSVHQDRLSSLPGTRWRRMLFPGNYYHYGLGACGSIHIGHGAPVRMRLSRSALGSSYWRRNQCQNYMVVDIHRQVGSAYI